MNSAKNILLASHGTEGAIAAERTAIGLGGSGSTIHHLVVVPDLWKGMMGDDWLNNGISRDRFGRHIESQLGQEIDDHSEGLRKRVEESDCSYTREIVLGKPDGCLIDTCNSGDYDLVVIGSPRPKGVSGLRSRMTPESLVRNLTTPLLVVPYPNE